MNYTIAETYELPSKGLIYNKPINPMVKLTSMTTRHELLRLNHSDRPMKVMADIIDDCMAEKCGISSYDMCIADYQYLLHKLRVVTYGSEYKVTSVCSLCGTQNSVTINLDEIPCTPFDDKYREYLSFELPRSQDMIALNIITPRIMDNIQIKTKEMKKQRQGFNGDVEFLVTLMQYIATVNGEKKPDYALEEYIMNLPLADSNHINNMANEFVKSFGLKGEVEFECDFCGLSYKSPFRITSEFYRPSI